MHKDWAARFEISNYKAKPIVYVGFRDKPNEYGFCNLAAQRVEKSEGRGVDTHASGFTTRYSCQYSNAVGLQTIEPKESLIFAVDKYEVKPLIGLDEKQKNAQIGFEFFVGDEKRREIVWSQDITFPNDPAE